MSADKFVVLAKQSNIESLHANDELFWTAIALHFNITGNTELTRFEQAFKDVPRHHPDLIEIFNGFKDKTNFGLFEIAGEKYSIEGISIIDEYSFTMIDYELITDISHLDRDINVLSF